MTSEERKKLIDNLNNMLLEAKEAAAKGGYFEAGESPKPRLVVDNTKLPASR
jgi:hypothetical protein